MWKWVQKYNYDSLRLEFVQSKYVSHYEFFQEVHGKDLAKNGTLNTNTSWRTNKKAEFMKEINAKALEEAKKKIVKSVSFDKEQLQVMKSMWLWLVKDKLNNAKPIYQRDENGKIMKDDKGLPIVVKEALYLDAWEIKTLINVCKLELGEPLTVVRNENVDLVIDEKDLEEDGDEWLTDEEKEIAQSISWLSDE